MPSSLSLSRKTLTPYLPNGCLGEYESARLSVGLPGFSAGAQPAVAVTATITLVTRGSNERLSFGRGPELLYRDMTSLSFAYRDDSSYIRRKAYIQGRAESI